MKQVILFISLLSLPLIGASQDFAAFLKLFPKTELPYQVPEGAFTDFPSEESERPRMGANIDESLAVTFLEAFEGTYSTYDAVAKIEQANYVLLIVFEVSMDMNNGDEKGVFMMYTLTNTGEYISSRIIGESGQHNLGDSFKIFDVTATLTQGEFEGDENKILITYTEDFSETITTDNYGETKQTIFTSYELIDEKGGIENVTVKIQE